jgi:hypothetical protein
MRGLLRSKSRAGKDSSWSLGSLLPRLISVIVVPLIILQFKLLFCALHESRTNAGWRNHWEVFRVRVSGGATAAT